MKNDKIEKIITMIKRDRNYGSDDFKGFESSLRHSLRLDQNEYDEFEIDEKLSYLNKVFFNGKTEQLTPENASVILEKMIEDFNREVEETQSTKANEKERNLFRQTKKKLKDFSNEIDIDEVSTYINQIMENEKQYDREEYNRILTRNNQKRINQKLDLLQSFTELNEKLSGNEKVKRHTNRIKEAILVIPATNEIGDPIGYGDFVRNTIIDYYTKNFPEFEIKFVVSHLDETTPHAHLFLDLKNKFTNKYDFSKKEIEFVERFVNDNKLLNLPKKPIFEDYKIPRRTEKRQKYLYDKDFKSWTASVLQTSFFQHFNESALKYEKPIYAKKLEKNKEYNERNKLIEEEAKKPKAERKFNFYQKSIADKELKINELNKEIGDNENKIVDQTNNLKKIKEKFDYGISRTKEVESKLEIKNNELNKAEEDHKNINQNIEKKKMEEKELLKSVSSLTVDIQNKQKEQEIITKSIKHLQVNESKIIEEINNKIDLSISSFTKRISSIVNKYKNKIELDIKDKVQSQTFRGDAMHEFTEILNKLKKMTVTLKTEDGFAKKSISALKGFFIRSTEKDKMALDDYYSAAKGEFDGFSTLSLFMTDKVIKETKSFEETKEIIPAYENTAKKVLDKRMENEYVPEVFKSIEKEIKIAAEEHIEQVAQVKKSNLQKLKLRP
ncbi:TPA: hypothetical protein ACIDXN_003664 [Pseudomonas aeruginosa]